MIKPTETPVPTPTITPAPVAKSISANLSGVEIDMRVPPGWSGRQINNGILIAERRSSIHNSEKLMGMQVYIFVHPVNNFPPTITGDAHPARRILQQIISEPDLVGNSAVTEPETFVWDGNDAAYYLLNDNNESMSLVMAVVLAQKSQLVAINVSCPAERAAAIREALPEIFNDLWVNDDLMSLTAIDSLPDPLIFPNYTEPKTIATLQN